MFISGARGTIDVRIAKIDTLTNFVFEASKSLNFSPHCKIVASLGTALPKVSDIRKLPAKRGRASLWSMIRIVHVMISSECARKHGSRADGIGNRRRKRIHADEKHNFASAAIILYLIKLITLIVSLFASIHFLVTLYSADRHWSNAVLHFAHHLEVELRHSESFYTVLVRKFHVIFPMRLSNVSNYSSS